MSDECHNEWRGYWWKLPIGLRNRWWEETDYGKKCPSGDLMADIIEAMLDPSNGAIYAAKSRAHDPQAYDKLLNDVSAALNDGVDK